MIRFLRDTLAQRSPGEVVSVQELFEQQRSRRAMICLFLAMLELVRRQAIVLRQKDAFGEIGIRRHKGFDQAFAAGEMTAIEEEYS